MLRKPKTQIYKELVGSSWPTHSSKHPKPCPLPPPPSCYSTIDVVLWLWWRRNVVTILHLQYLPLQIDSRIRFIYLFKKMKPKFICHPPGKAELCCVLTYSGDLPYAQYPWEIDYLVVVRRALSGVIPELWKSFPHAIQPFLSRPFFVCVCVQSACSWIFASKILSRRFSGIALLLVCGFGLVDRDL